MGYEKDFIHGFEVPMPILGNKALESALNQVIPIEHSRFSLVFNQDRGFAMYTAHNIDGAMLIREGEIPRRDRFKFEPKVDRRLQVDNDRAYVNNPCDRGHLVHRRSLHWRDIQEATLADRESFFWTNIAPQHEHLQDTARGRIEDWMLGYAA